MKTGWRFVAEARQLRHAAAAAAAAAETANAAAAAAMMLVMRMASEGRRRGWLIDGSQAGRPRSLRNSGRGGVWAVDGGSGGVWATGCGKR